MKKYLFLALALLGLTPAFGQTDDDDAIFNSSNIGKPRNYAIHVGPRIGLTTTSMTQPLECDLYDGMGLGFSAGASMKVRLGHMSENSDGGTGLLGFGLDLKYKQNKVKTIGDSDLSLGYFEVPVMLQLYPFYKITKLNGLYVEAGVDMAGTLSKSPDLLTVLQPTGRVVYHTGDLKGFDCRIPLGLGYTLRNGLDVNLRYYIGTSELAENMPCKMSSMEVSVAWMFRVSKK